MGVECSSGKVSLEVFLSPERQRADLNGVLHPALGAVRTWQSKPRKVQGQGVLPRPSIPGTLVSQLAKATESCGARRAYSTQANPAPFVFTRGGRQIHFPQTS